MGVFFPTGSGGHQTYVGECSMALKHRLWPRTCAPVSMVTQVLKYYVLYLLTSPSSNSPLVERSQH